MMKGAHSERALISAPGRRLLPLLACALPALMMACSQGAPAPNEPTHPDHAEGVPLNTEQIRALGLTTEPAHGGDYQESIQGFGVVISLETFAQAYADVATASASAAQSSAALSRARSLAGGEEAAVSQEVLEGAASKAASDEAALALAQRKSEAIFGLHAPWRTASDRKRVMDQLTHSHAILVHVTFPLGLLTGKTPEELTIARITPDAHSWYTKVIWPAPADPTVPGSGFFVLLEGSDLSQGEHVVATAGVGERVKGVWIPQSALLLSESSTWVYVETEAGRYRRIRVDVGQPHNAGYVLKSDAGIKPDQKVVVTGASLLLAHELNPSGPAVD